MKLKALSAAILLEVIDGLMSLAGRLFKIRISFFKNRTGSDSKISIYDHLCNKIAIEK